MGSTEHQHANHPPKVPLPDAMPAFSLDNPIQALYLKRRSVERILDKSVGKTLGFSFVSEKRTNIEKESMLVDRTEVNDLLPPTLETIESFEESSSEDERTTSTSSIKATDKDYEKFPDLAYYDSEAEGSESWSLPGIEHDKSTDIRYIYRSDSEVFYDDGHFYDDERRERKHALAPEDPRKSQDSFITTLMGFLAWHFTICHAADFLYLCSSSTYIEPEECAPKSLTLDSA